jgi:hypothetical protein
MQELSLHINGLRYPVAVHIERRRSARASIGKRGVVIRLPVSLSAGERRSHLERLMAWARRRLERRPVRRYEDGQELVVAGQRYVLRVSLVAGSRSSGRIGGGEILIRIPASLPEVERGQKIAERLSACLAREHREWIRGRVVELNRLHFRASVGKISLRNTRVTWGSCSRSGSLSFSSRLLLAPPEIVDYVCIHELAHRLVPNHSPAFWALVRRALPELDERRRWLRRHGAELTW